MRNTFAFHECGGVGSFLQRHAGHIQNGPTRCGIQDCSPFTLETRISAQIRKCMRHENCSLYSYLQGRDRGKNVDFFLLVDDENDS